MAVTVEMLQRAIGEVEGSMRSSILEIETRMETRFQGVIAAERAANNAAIERDVVNMQADTFDRVDKAVMEQFKVQKEAFDQAVTANIWKNSDCDQTPCTRHPKKPSPRRGVG